MGERAAGSAPRTGNTGVSGGDSAPGARSLDVDTGHRPAPTPEGEGGGEASVEPEGDLDEHAEHDSTKAMSKFTRPCSPRTSATSQPTSAAASVAVSSSTTSTDSALSMRLETRSGSLICR